MIQKRKKDWFGKPIDLGADYSSLHCIDRQADIGPTILVVGDYGCCQR